MLQKNIYGQCGKLKGDSDILEFDSGLFLQRILLFENFTLNSIRLKEIPLLAKQFGFDGLVNLLKMDFLKIHCEAFSIGQIGQTSALKSTQKKGVLPKFSYRFATVRIADQNVYINGCLKEIRGIQFLNRKQKQIIENLVLEKLVVVNKETPDNIFKAFKSDVNNSALLEKSIRKIASVPAPCNLRLEVHQIADDDWKVETNLCEAINIDNQEGHKIVQTALLNIAGLSKTIFKMQDFDSLSGFHETGDYEIYTEKLKPLGEKLSEKKLDENFMHLIELKDLPDLGEIAQKENFSIEKLLEIRESDECKEFREWLWDMNKYSDKELTDRLTSLRSRSGNFLDSKSGKVIRFGVNTIAGLLTSSVANVPLSIADTFLVEKILKKDSVSAFINSQYPKLYK